MGRVFPKRLAIRPPINGERPARQLLAGIPFALSIMQQAARREACLQAPHQILGIVALGRTDGRGIPLRAFDIVDRDEGRFSAHAQADIASPQLRVDSVASVEDRLPLFIAIRLGDARRLDDPVDAHVERERDLGLLVAAADGGRARWIGGCGQRNMALAGQQTRGRIESDPTGARHVDLGPGMEVGEILGSACWSVERLFIGLELNEITRHEAGGEPEPAEDLHQQPAAVAA